MDIAAAFTTPTTQYLAIINTGTGHVDLSENGRPVGTGSWNGSSIWTSTPWPEATLWALEADLRGSLNTWAKAA